MDEMVKRVAGALEHAYLIGMYGGDQFNPPQEDDLDLTEATALLADSLDAAWAEAEAAAGTYLLSDLLLMRNLAGDGGFRYEAQAFTKLPDGGAEMVETYGPTPTAALRALTAKLRGEG